MAEVPFDSDYKFMATFHNMKNEQGKPVVRCFVKGAPDVLIARSGSYLDCQAAKCEPVTEENRPLALEENERMAQGRRARHGRGPPRLRPGDLRSEGEADRPGERPDVPGDGRHRRSAAAEAKAAIAKCHSAGIQVRMITGDHAVTAAAIGHELGIEGKALTGAQFAAIERRRAEEATRPDIGVVARVAPEDKIRLVRLLQEQQQHRRDDRRRRERCARPSRRPTSASRWASPAPRSRRGPR